MEVAHSIIVHLVDRGFMNYEALLEWLITREELKYNKLRVWIDTKMFEWRSTVAKIATTDIEIAVAVAYENWINTLSEGISIRHTQGKDLLIRSFQEEYTTCSGRQERIELIQKYSGRIRDVFSAEFEKAYSAWIGLKMSLNGLEPERGTGKNNIYFALSQSLRCYHEALESSLRAIVKHIAPEFPDVDILKRTHSEYIHRVFRIRIESADYSFLRDNVMRTTGCTNLDLYTPGHPAQHLYDRLRWTAKAEKYQEMINLSKDFLYKLRDRLVIAGVVHYTRASPFVRI